MLKIRHIFLYIFLLFPSLISYQSCSSKVQRACETDQDCIDNEKYIYCLHGTCSDHECDPGEKTSCYTGKKEEIGVGICHKGEKICTNAGFWTGCLGEMTPKTEICDKIDNDCNGKIDDVHDSKKCHCKYPGMKRLCYSGKSSWLDKGQCVRGIQYCDLDHYWGKCIGQFFPEPEICDGIDNNCNGKIDDNPKCLCIPNQKRSCYRGLFSTMGVGRCKAGIQICGQDKHWKPCQGDILPTNETNDKTRCNGIDDNCNGVVDEFCSKTCPKNKKTRCNGTCVDLATNILNCGKCGQICSTGQICLDGRCQCPKGQILCDGTCVDPSTNRKHCGKCQQTCQGKELCVEGHCGICPTHLTVCGKGDKAICINLKNNEAHCGSCDNHCSNIQNCVNGQCQFKDGATRSCYDGPKETLNKGICRAGIQHYKNGQWSQCTGQILPKKEICDYLDDNCDGKIDNITFGENLPKQGVCNSSDFKAFCKNGRIVVSYQYTQDEQNCDGLDNDCDGQTDENCLLSYAHYAQSNRFTLNKFLFGDHHIVDVTHHPTLPFIVLLTKSNNSNNYQLIVLKIQEHYPQGQESALQKNTPYIFRQKITSKTSYFFSQILISPSGKTILIIERFADNREIQFIRKLDAKTLFQQMNAGQTVHSSLNIQSIDLTKYMNHQQCFIGAMLERGRKLKYVCALHNNFLIVDLSSSRPTARWLRNKMVSLKITALNWPVENVIISGYTNGIALVWYLSENKGFLVSITGNPISAITTKVEGKRYGYFADKIAFATKDMADSFIYHLKIYDVAKEQFTFSQQFEMRYIHKLKFSSHSSNLFIQFHNDPNTNNIDFPNNNFAILNVDKKQYIRAFQYDQISIKRFDVKDNFLIALTATPFTSTEYLQFWNLPYLKNPSKKQSVLHASPCQYGSKVIQVKFFNDNQYIAVLEEKKLSFLNLNTTSSKCQKSISTNLSDNYEHLILSSNQSRPFLILAKKDKVHFTDLFSGKFSFSSLKIKSTLNGSKSRKINDLQKIIYSPQADQFFALLSGKTENGFFFSTAKQFLKKKLALEQNTLYPDELNSVDTIAFSPSGKFLAIAGKDLNDQRQIQIRSTEDLSFFLWQTSIKNAIKQLHFSANGRFLAALSQKKLQIWTLDALYKIKDYKNMNQPLQGKPLQLSESQYQQLAWSPDRHHIALFNNNQEMAIYTYSFDQKNHKMIFKKEILLNDQQGKTKFTEKMTGLEWSQDGHYLAGIVEHSLLLWSSF